MSERLIIYSLNNAIYTRRRGYYGETLRWSCHNLEYVVTYTYVNQKRTCCSIFFIKKLPDIHVTVVFQSEHTAENSSARAEQLEVLPTDSALQQANSQNTSTVTQNTNIITEKKAKRKARRKQLLSNIASRRRLRRLRHRAKMRRRRKQKKERSRKQKKKQKANKKLKRKPSSKRRKHASRKAHPTRKSALEQFSRIDFSRTDVGNSNISESENSTESEISKVYLAIKILRSKNDRRQFRIQQRRGPKTDDTQDSIVFEEIDSDFGSEDYVFPEDVEASRNRNADTGRRVVQG